MCSCVFVKPLQDVSLSRDADKILERRSVATAVLSKLIHAHIRTKHNNMVQIAASHTKKKLICNSCI